MVINASLPLLPLFLYTCVCVCFSLPLRVTRIASQPPPHPPPPHSEACVPSSLLMPLSVCVFLRCYLCFVEQMCWLSRLNSLYKLYICIENCSSILRKQNKLLTIQSQVMICREICGFKQSWALSVFFNFFNDKKWFVTFFIKLIWLGVGFLNRTGAEIGY